MPRDDDFTGEAEELLESLSRDLADFEAQGAGVRPELINKIFRDVHSLKGLAGMLGFTAISELAHALEDTLDRLRMGKIAIGKQLIDLLYDGVDALNRLVSGMTADASTQMSPTAQMVPAEPQQKIASLLDELTLEEQTRKSLTEYEEHRLIENVRSGKNVFSIEQRFEFSDFDKKLRALTVKLTESGEVISPLPSVDPTGAGIGFRLLYGSSRDVSAVAEVAPDAKITSLRKVEEEEISLRSVSATVRVDIAKLDVVMNTIGEMLIEKNQLDALARTLDARQRNALPGLSRQLDRQLDAT